MSHDPSARLTEALRANEALWECLHRCSALKLPDWYLGAGCVAQTIWNLAHGKPPSEDILDYDLVYYDRESVPDRERAIAAEAGNLVRDLPIELDVTNQARVHEWYPRVFGYRIQPYQSTGGGDRDMADDRDGDRHSPARRGARGVGTVWHRGSLRPHRAAQPCPDHTVDL